MEEAEKRKTVGYALPSDLAEWVGEAATKAGVSKSAFVAQVLERARRVEIRRKGK